MRESFDELLLRGGLLTADGLAAARAEAIRTNKRLADCILELQLIDERTFAEWIARTSETVLLDPIPEEAAAAAVHQIPRAIVRELQVVPLRYADGDIFVAMTNPLDAEALGILHAVSARPIRSVTGVRSDIVRLVDRFFPDDSADEETQFDVSNETLLRRPPELDFLREHDVPAAGDDDFGTMIAARLPESELAPKESHPPMEDATTPTNPIVAIERRLDQIVAMIHDLDKRLDRLESLFSDEALNR